MASVLNWGDKILGLAERHKVLTVSSLMLSTLGGAYSALGDVSIARSLQAEALAHYQYRVAMSLGDAGLAKRCQFFVAWSIIQRRDFDHATRILVGLALPAVRRRPQPDTKLLCMCDAAWHRIWFLRRGGALNASDRARCVLPTLGSGRGAADGRRGARGRDGEEGTAGTGGVAGADADVPLAPWYGGQGAAAGDGS